MKIALGIEYNGHPFFGWQKQPHLLTIQGCLEEALSKVADELIDVFCAGRTDAGVHAIGQVVHFNTNVTRTTRAWVMGANTHLPRGVAVHWSTEVDEAFHARFSALSRRYRYVIYNHSTRPAILSNGVTWLHQPLAIDKMQEAAQYLVGEHDFSSFRSSECQSKTAMRNIHKIEMTRHHEYLILEIQANAFLHHMVRNIVGVLKKIGEGHKPPIWAQSVLHAKDRKIAAETAPPDGLYLLKVDYGDKYRFPNSPKTIIIP